MATPIPEDLIIVAQAYRELGAELERMPATDRRQMINVIVQSIAVMSPVALADLAACASWRLALDGAK